MKVGRLIEKIYEIKSYNQVKALTHPIRRSIFTILGDFKPRTSQQLSKELNLPRNKVHYHIQELVKVGLLVLDHVKTNGNFKEKYFVPIANKIIFNIEDGIETKASRIELDQSILSNHQVKYLQAVQSYENDKANPNPLLIGLRKDLTKEQASQLKQELISVLDKWYEINNEEKKDTQVWEVSISLYPTD